MDGRFDLINCFFEVTLKPYDSYSSFDKDADTEYNIIKTELPLLQLLRHMMPNMITVAG